MIPLWAILALAAALLSSFNPIIYKRILRDSNVVVTTWAGQAFSIPLLALVAFFWVQPLPSIDALFLVGISGSAILNILANFALNRALQIADASLVTPFLTFNPVFTLLIAAVTLQEFQSRQGLFGVLLVILGANLVNAQPDWRASVKRLALNRGILFTIFASFIWGITPIFEKIAILHTRPENPPLVALGSTFLLAVILSPVLFRQAVQLQTADNPQEQIHRHWRGFALLGLIGGVTPVFGMTAFMLGNVGYVTALFKLSTIFTLFWSYLWLNERTVARRLPGALVMLVGAILIAA